MSCASAGAESTPASRNTRVADRTTPDTGTWTGSDDTALRPRHGLGLFHTPSTVLVRERVEHRVQFTVEHGIEVVGLEPHPVIGDPVLREVVCADAFGTVDGADLVGPALRGLER